MGSLLMRNDTHYFEVMRNGDAAEKQVLRDQANSQAKGGKPKPANIIEKIISGRVNKVRPSRPGRPTVSNLMQ